MQTRLFWFQFPVDEFDGEKLSYDGIYQTQTSTHSLLFGHFNISIIIGGSNRDYQIVTVI